MATKKSITINVDLNKKKLVELRKMAADLNLDTEGKKADLIARIVDAGARKSTKKEITIGSPVKKAKKAAKKVLKKKTSPKKVLKKKTSPKKPVAKKSKSPKKASPKKPAAKKAKSSANAAVKAKGAAKKKISKATKYSKLTKDELNEICMTRNLSEDCLELSKEEIVNLLEEWDRLKLDKSPKKPKSPAAKKTAGKKVAKKTTVKKARCDDEKDFIECEPGTICSTTSGVCVKDTPAARKGKSELHVDGRVIVGSSATIKNLHKILGGEIVSASPKAKAPKKAAKKVTKKVTKKVSPVPSPKKLPSPQKSPSPKKKSLSPKKKSPSPKKAKKTVVKKAKKSPVKPKVKSPSPVEDEVADEEEKDIKKKVASLKKGAKVSTKVQPGKVELSKREVAETFQACLESLVG